MSTEIAPVNAILDELVKTIQDHFNGFILASTSHALGSRVLDTLADEVCITATVGLNIQMEPIPVSELWEFKRIYPDFVVEVFHGKLLQHWQDVLGEIFACYVDLHLTGQLAFAELGNMQLKVDFRDKTPLAEQVHDCLTRDFDFWRYADKHRLINRLRNPQGKQPEASEVILKHVHIRNAFQHHHGILQPFVFKELERQELVLLDERGHLQTFRLGDKVSLSVPELDSCRRSLLVMAQTWRAR